MSPRRNHRHGRRPLGPTATDAPSRFGAQETVEWRGDAWVVRRIAGSAAAKHYRCPGCDQEIPPGMAHVVVWPDHGGVEDRRHWHRACWEARDRRGVRPQRTRNAPRY